jgi:uncharacterized membrane protein
MTKAKYDHVDHPLERVMFFSDAVFAIAITLLIIEIKVPHVRGMASADAWAAVGNLWPSFIAYVLSFLVIGRFWMAHHSALGVMDHHVPKLIWPNMFLLLLVAFMPFSTAFMAENLGRLVPTLFYNLSLLALSICSAWVVAIAIARENAREGFSDRDRIMMKARGHGVIITTLIVCIATFFVPFGLSQILLSLMPLAQRLLNRLYARNLAADV